MTPTQAQETKPNQGSITGIVRKKESVCDWTVLSLIRHVH